MDKAARHGIALAMLLALAGNAGTALAAGKLDGSGVPAAESAAVADAGRRLAESLPESQAGARREPVPAWTPPASVTVEYAPRPPAAEKALQVSTQRRGWDRLRMQRKQLPDGTVVIDLGGQGRQSTVWTVVADGRGLLQCDAHPAAFRRQAASVPGRDQAVPETAAPGVALR